MLTKCKGNTFALCLQTYQICVTNKRLSMKKLLLVIAIILGEVNGLSAKMFPLTFAGDDFSTTMPGHSKNPVLPWYVDITNNVISMEATPCDYTLNLYDEDEDVVYSVFVPAGTTQVILPTTLSGNFELHFETDTYYYYGFIYL